MGKAEIKAIAATAPLSEKSVATEQDGVCHSRSNPSAVRVMLSLRQAIFHAACAKLPKKDHSGHCRYWPEKKLHLMPRHPKILAKP
jgi:hypothetical protein